jgi:hypothetical protein
MNQFFLVINKQVLTKVELDHAKCLELVAYAPIHILSKDLEEWRDSAKHLGVFKLNFNVYVLCLDLERLIP